MIQIPDMKIPVWLIAICLFVFIGVILEQLYYSKRPVSFWGVELNQPTSNPAPIDGLNIIGSNSSSDSSGIFQDTFNLKHSALLLFQAHGNAARRSGSVENASVQMRLKVDGKSCGTNQSFEGSSTNITFFAGVTCIKRLSAGSHNLEAKQVNDLGITNTGAFEANYVLLKIGSN